MRYRIVAKAIGDVTIQGTILAERDGILFEFIPDNLGKLSLVAISIQVPQDKVQNFASSISQTGLDVPLSITIGGDREIHERLVAELQVLEAHLSFATISSLQNIDWNNLEQEEFIAESSEEKNLLAVSGVSSKIEYPKTVFHVSPESISQLVDLMPLYDSLTIPKSFFQEGMNFFRNFQYITAYYHFFFVIEDFYADGKFSGRGVIDEFNKSREFVGIATNALQQLFADERHRANLLKFFIEENCDVSPQGLQKLLFHLRGNLHHYHSKSPKTRGTPINHKEYESIALIAMYIVRLAIGLREATISTSIGNKISGAA